MQDPEMLSCIFVGIDIGLEYLYHCNDLFGAVVHLRTELDLWALLLHISFEVFQYGLPSFPLHFDGVLVLGIEDRSDLGAVFHRLKGGGGLPAVGHGVCDTLPWDDLIVNGLEIKTKAAVLCFHPGRIGAPDPEIVAGRRAAPIIGCKGPIDNMLRLVPKFPYLIRWGPYGGLHFYLFVFYCSLFLKVLPDQYAVFFSILINYPPQYGGKNQGQYQAAWVYHGMCQENPDHYREQYQGTQGPGLGE